MKKLWVIVAALTAVGVMASPAFASDHKLTGTMTVSPGPIPAGLKVPGEGDSCTGSGVSAGFDDVQEGAAVKVKDGKGKILATSGLGSGVQDDQLQCVFKFSMKIPDASTYSVEISHRGALVYSKNALAKRKWKVAFVLTDTSS